MEAVPTAVLSADLFSPELDDKLALQGQRKHPWDSTEAYVDDSDSPV